MEVHKHPHHVTHKKKWGEYLLEFFMLFLAVFLGFVAENFREHSVERLKEKEYMRSLVNDLKTDTAIINFTIIYNQNLHSADSMLLQLLHTPLTATDTADFNLIYKLYPKTENFSILFNDSKTYDQMKSTGDYRLIKNPKVLDNMSKYYQSIAADKIFRDEIQAQLQLTYNFSHKIFNLYSFEKHTETISDFSGTDTHLLKEYINKLYLLMRDFKIFNEHLARINEEAIKFMGVIRDEYHLEND